MAKSLKYFLSVIVLVAFFSSCKKDEELCGFKEEPVNTEKMMTEGDKETTIQINPSLRDGGTETESDNPDLDGNGISDDDDDESDDDKSGKVKSN